MLLIENLNIVDSIDFSSSGYAAQLFSIFNNNLLFCLKENKETECIVRLKFFLTKCPSDKFLLQRILSWGLHIIIEYHQLFTFIILLALILHFSIFRYFFRKNMKI